MSMRSPKISFLALAGLACMAAVGSAKAETVTVFTFQGDTDPVRQQVKPKELTYSPTTGLRADTGAVGNGLPTSPGISGMITGGLAGITQSPPGFGPSAPYNFLTDLTLVLVDGFQVDGAAISSPGVISQGLTGGHFEIRNPAFSKPLLAGYTDGALITAVRFGPSGAASNVAIQSGLVTYTDSILENEFADAGLIATGGSFAFALTGITGTFGTTIYNDLPRLAAFRGDAAGSFDADPPQVVPTPAAFCGGSAVLLGLAATRVRRFRSLRA